MEPSEEDELKQLIHADFSAASNRAKPEPPLATGGKRKPRKATGKSKEKELPAVAVTKEAAVSAAAAVLAAATPARSAKADDKPAQLFLCEKCEKTYKTKSGLIKHKVVCLK